MFVVAATVAVLLTSCATKALLIWKSNTSLYNPPEQPSFTVRGTLLQLLILIKSLLSGFASNPVASTQFIAFIIASGLLPLNGPIVLPLILNVSSGFSENEVSRASDADGWDERSGNYDYDDERTTAAATL